MAAEQADLLDDHRRCVAPAARQAADLHAGDRQAREIAGLVALQGPQQEVEIRCDREGGPRDRGSVYDLVVAKGWLTREKLDDLLKPENMTHPRLVR